jgi:hypothetical protein
MGKQKTANAKKYIPTWKWVELGREWIGWMRDQGVLVPSSLLFFRVQYLHWIEFLRCGKESECFASSFSGICQGKLGGIGDGKSEGGDGRIGPKIRMEFEGGELASPNSHFNLAKMSGWTE